MNGKRMILLAAALMLTVAAYGQKELRASWVAKARLGDGRTRHFEMDNSNAYGDPEKGTPLNGLYRIYSGDRDGYTLAEFKDGLYNGSYECLEHSTLYKRSYVEGVK